jgi:small-conductance mechanosensitive channel
MAEANTSLDTNIIGNIQVIDILAIGIILLIAVVVAKIVTIYLKKSLSDRMDKNELRILIRVIQYFILLIGLLIASPHFRIDLSGLLVAGGVAGLIIGFASQSVVSNLVSGLFLIIERPIKIGDNISVAESSGIVYEIRVLSTTIRTYEGVYTRIPNEKVFTSTITNYVANVARRFDYIVGISYRDDAERASSLINALIEAHPYVLKNPSPTIFVDDLSDSSVKIVVRVWAPSSLWYEAKKELLWRIKCELEKNSIEIPYPQHVVYLKEEGRGI